MRFHDFFSVGLKLIKFLTSVTNSVFMTRWKRCAVVRCSNSRYIALFLLFTDLCEYRVMDLACYVNWVSIRGDWWRNACENWSYWLDCNSCGCLCGAVVMAVAQKESFLCCNFKSRCTTERPGLSEGPSRGWSCVTLPGPTVCLSFNTQY